MNTAEIRPPVYADVHRERSQAWTTCADGTPRPVHVLGLGYSVVPHAITMVHSLRPTDRMLWRLTFGYANMNGLALAYPGQRLLALQLRTDRKSVRNRLKRLDEFGCFRGEKKGPRNTICRTLNPELCEGTYSDVVETRRRLDALRDRPPSSDREPPQGYVYPEHDAWRHGLDMLPWALLYHDELHPRDLELLCVLWGYTACQKYRVYLGGVEYLAALTGEKYRNVRDRLRRLDGLGLIKRVRRRAGLTSLYIPTWEMTDDLWRHVRPAWERVERHTARRSQHTPAPPSQHTPAPPSQHTPAPPSIDNGVQQELQYGQTATRGASPVQIEKKRRGKKQHRGQAGDAPRVTAGHLRAAIRAAASEADAVKVLNAAGLKRGLATSFVERRGLAWLLLAVRSMPDAKPKKGGNGNPMGWLLEADKRNWTFGPKRKGRR